VEAAVVYFKPRRNQVDDKPDLWVAETDLWVEFPGEDVEDGRSESPLEQMRRGVFISEPTVEIVIRGSKNGSNGNSNGREH
jgi:hypothetical protein